jgi:gamma-butyrobetaine dioxygenase
MNRYSKQKTRKAGHNDPARKLWNRSKMEKNVSFIDYEDYMKDEDKLWEAVLALSQYGLVFLKNCPKDEKAIEGMVERIGELKNTFYGHTWNVKSIKDSKNIA